MEREENSGDYTSQSSIEDNVTYKYFTYYLCAHKLNKIFKYHVERS